MKILKSISLFSMLLVVSLVLVACGGNGGNASNVDFEFHAFRNSGVEDAGDIARIMNATELASYLSKHDISDGDFYDFIAEHYTIDFFAQNYIVFASLAGGGGDTFVVENVKSNGNIYVNQSPGILTNVETWVVVIELPRTVDPTTFNIELNKV